MLFFNLDPSSRIVGTFTNDIIENLTTPIAIGGKKGNKSNNFLFRKLTFVCLVCSPIVIGVVQNLFFVYNVIPTFYHKNLGGAISE